MPGKTCQMAAVAPKGIVEHILNKVESEITFK